MSELAARKKIDLKWLHTIIVFLLMFGFGQLPPIAPITELGMKVLGVFLGMLYGWSTCGILWPSLLGLIGMGFAGTFPSISKTISGGFSADIFIFMMFFFILIEALNNCGLITFITNWLLTRRMINGRPWLFATILFFIGYLLCACGQFYAAIFVVWGMWYDIFKRIGAKPFEKMPMLMLTGTVIAVNLGGMIFPFLNAPLVMLGAYSAMTNEAINFAKYFIFVMPLTILFYLEFFALCKYVFKVDLTPLNQIDPQSILGGGELRINRRQKAMGLYFILVLIVLFIPGCFPKSWAIVQLLSNFGNTGITITAIIGLLLIRVDGEPLLDFRKAAASGINWDILMMIIMITMMSGNLSSEATGISAFIGQMLTPMLGGKSFFIFIVIYITSAALLTNVMNNVVVCILFMPVLIAFGPALGVDNWVIMILLVIACQLAILTPAASPAAAILFANTEWLELRRVIKYIVPTFIVWLLTLIFLGTPIVSMLF